MLQTNRVVFDHIIGYFFWLSERERLPCSHEWWTGFDRWCFRFFLLRPEVFREYCFHKNLHKYSSIIMWVISSACRKFLFFWWWWKIPHASWVFRLALEGTAYILIFLSSRKHIRPLPDCGFLQNTAGCLRPVEWSIMYSLFSRHESSNRVAFLWARSVLPFLLLLFSKMALLVRRSGPHRMGGSKEEKHEWDTLSCGCQLLTENLICARSHFLVALGGFLGELCCSTVKM